MATKWMMKASALFLAASVLAAGCGGAKTVEPTTPTTPTPVAQAKFKVGMVTDVGGLNDQSFNAAAWAGLKKAEKDLGFGVTAVESTRQEDYESNYQTLADGKNDLIWGIGFLMSEATDKLSKKLTSQKFAMIDAVVANPNVASVVFKEEEGSFLMGVLAAKTTKTKTVGFVGGMKIDVIDHFEAGYNAGVKSVDPTIKVIPVYAESFTDANKGKEITLAMIGKGADVVFHASGSVGKGVIDAAKEKGIFAIGVDQDQNKLAPATVISSMMKRVDVATFDISKMTKDGNFPGGKTIVMGLKENGVGYADTTLWDKTPAGTKALVDKWADAIKAGTVKVPNTMVLFKGWEVPKL